MKKYNYNNLKENEHVVPSLGVLPIKINDDYDFIPKNLFIDFITDILIRPIALILYFIAKIFLGFKITGKENFYHDVINELNNIVVQMYPEASLWHYYENIRDLKQKTETMMKEKINENIDIIL